MRNITLFFSRKLYFSIKTIACLKGSFVFQEFPDQKEREEFLQSAADERVLEEIKKASNLVVTSVKEKTFTLADLKKMFKKVKNSSDRNTKIYQAYNEGFSQHAIAAKNLGLSQPYINRIVKQMREK